MEKPKCLNCGRKLNVAMLVGRNGKINKTN